MDAAESSTTTRSPGPACSGLGLDDSTRLGLQWLAGILQTAWAGSLSLVLDLPGAIQLQIGNAHATAARVLVLLNRASAVGLVAVSLLGIPILYADNPASSAGPIGR